MTVKTWQMEWRKVCKPQLITMVSTVQPPYLAIGQRHVFCCWICSNASCSYCKSKTFSCNRVITARACACCHQSVSSSWCVTLRNIVGRGMSCNMFCKPFQCIKTVLCRVNLLPNNHQTNLSQSWSYGPATRGSQFCGVGHSLGCVENTDLWKMGSVERRNWHEISHTWCAISGTFLLCSQI